MDCRWATGKELEEVERVPGMAGRVLAQMDAGMVLGHVEAGRVPALVVAGRVLAQVEAGRVLAEVVRVLGQAERVLGQAEVDRLRRSDSFRFAAAWLFAQRR